MAGWMDGWMNGRDGMIKKIQIVALILELQPERGWVNVKLTLEAHSCLTTRQCLLVFHKMSNNCCMTGMIYDCYHV